MCYMHTLSYDWRNYHNGGILECNYWSQMSWTVCCIVSQCCWLVQHDNQTGYISQKYQYWISAMLQVSVSKKLLLLKGRKHMGSKYIMACSFPDAVVYYSLLVLEAVLHCSLLQFTSVRSSASLQFTIVYQCQKQCLSYMYYYCNSCWYQFSYGCTNYSFRSES